MAGINAEDKVFDKCYDHIIDQICYDVLDVLSETFESDYTKI